MTVIWQGTVDNLELTGMPNGDKQPMRIVESADGNIATEFANSKESDDGMIEYDESSWSADYQMRFRDMDPPADAALRQRLISKGVIEA